MPTAMPTAVSATVPATMSTVHGVLRTSLLPTVSAPRTALPLVAEFESQCVRVL